MSITPRELRMIPGGKDTAAVIYSLYEVRIIKIPDEVIKTYSLNIVLTNSMAVSEDGRFLALGYEDNIIRVVDLQTDEWVHHLFGHKARINTLVFHGEVLYSAGRDKQVMMWDARAGQHATVLKQAQLNDSSCTKMAISSGGSILAVAHLDGIVCIASSKTLKEIDRLSHGARARVLSVCFAPRSPANRTTGGMTLLSITAKGAIYVWDLFSAEEGDAICRRIIDDGTNWGFGVTVSPDGRYVASAAEDETVRVWSLEDETIDGMSIPCHEAFINFVVFSGDKLLLSGSEDGTIHENIITESVPLDEDGAMDVS